MQARHANCITETQRLAHLLTPLSFTLSACEETIRLTPVSQYTNSEALFAAFAADQAIPKEQSVCNKSVRTREDIQHFLQEVHASVETLSAAYYLITIRQQATAGIIALNPIAWADQTACFGCWLFQAYRGQGLMTQATICLSRYYRLAGIKKFLMRCSTQNISSQKLALRAGFKYLGTTLSDSKSGESSRDEDIFEKCLS